MPRRRRPPRAGALTELPPLKILGQIAAIQALYYGCALFLMLFTTLVAGTNFSLDLVFGWNAVRGDTTQGWLMAFVWVLDGGLFMYGPLSCHISLPYFPLAPTCPHTNSNFSIGLLPSFSSSHARNSFSTLPCRFTLFTWWL